jgi:hypothetical protein
MGERHGLLSPPVARQDRLGVFGLLVCLLVIAGLAGGGLPAGLAVSGLALLLIGSGAALVGRARWAFIAGRKASGAEAAAGLVMLAVGAAAAPPTAPAATRLARPDARRSVSVKKLRCSACGPERMAPERRMHQRPRSHLVGPDTCGVPHATGRLDQSDRNSGRRGHESAHPRALAHGADGGRSTGSDRNSSHSKPDRCNDQRLNNSTPRNARATRRHWRGQVTDLL